MHRKHGSGARWYPLSRMPREPFTQDRANRLESLSCERLELPPEAMASMAALVDAARRPSLRLMVAASRRREGA